MNKLIKRSKEKKGFTLVEVIVVLVILAILAAILIPSMVGWIDKAQNKTAIVEARTVLLAAQTVASEDYASDSAVATVDGAEVIALAGVEGSLTGDIAVGAGMVTSFTYVSSDGITVVYHSTADADGAYDKGFEIEE
ncbi:MAG: prepilin-type N-terminal cleavage/methylation domain-containing protein [Bacillota bacterium]|nr:prepilin-type N-terminal cleavage/methylation domain-containing protein [Bacillota bacterium]